MPSLRSGPIQSGGASCVAKKIEGPARINFWWRADQDIPQVGMLVFMVDNETILQCTSSNWSPMDYAVTSGSHRLSWEYRKLRSYPEYVGAGWIDDLMIVYPKERMPEVLQGNVSCCDQLPAIKGNIERVNRSFAGLETRVDQIDLDLGNLSYNQTVLENRTRIGDLNISQSDLNELVRRLNLSELDERLRQIDIKIGDVNRKIANLSPNQTAPSNLSWIWENVVYVSNNRVNLEEVINKNRNKTILLGDGVYHIDGLQITTDNVTIRSLRKWGAILDANDAREGVLLDTVKNVRIESLIIMNCTNGMHIENGTDCYIIDNIFTDFKEIGVFVKNSSNCSFILNIVKPLENFKKFGIQLNETSDYNQFLFNSIYIDKQDDRSRLYDIDQSCIDNVLYVSDAGRIEEGDVVCEINNSEGFQCSTEVFGPRNTWKLL
ncbi:MAG: NosD domain-containing protein [Methanothrix sp.]